MLDQFGNMPTRCTLSVGGRVFDGQVGATRVRGDVAEVEIGADVVTISRDSVRDYELIDPVLGFEYCIRVR